MCNRYTPPKELEIEREWRVGKRNPLRRWDDVLAPGGTGAFIRTARQDAGYSCDLAVGHEHLVRRAAEARVIDDQIVEREPAAGDATSCRARARGSNST